MTSAVGDGGSIAFLEEGFTLWDRKFGDPRLLAHDRAQPSSKYDGKLSGNWVFPFSIPFPAHVDFTTLHAVYPRESEGPVRFLPEPLDRELPPGNLGRGPVELQPSYPSTVTPFDLGSPGPRTGFAFISPPAIPAPSTPSLSAYTHHDPETTDPPTTLYEGDTKSGRSVHSPQASATSGRQRSTWATSMHKPSTPTTVYLLPQSFLERDIIASVRYEMTLNITHGIFSTKSKSAYFHSLLVAHSISWGIT
jgi:hypothetical protein